MSKRTVLMLKKHIFVFLLNNQNQISQTMKIKRLIFSAIFSLITYSSFAGGAPNLTGAAMEFFNQTVRPLFIPIVCVIFIISAMFNIGDITGENRNYKAFFYKIAIYVGAVVVVGLVLNFFLSYSI